MLERIDHIGIAVKSEENAVAVFNKLFGFQPTKKEEVESEGVLTIFYLLGETKIELLVATTADSPISKFIEKRGEGIHHIAFEVDDIQSEMSRMVNEGFRVLNEHPKDGADNKLINFIHPKETSGVLIELCQTKK